MPPIKGEYLLVVVTLVAAAGWLFSKAALQNFPSYTFLALRFSLACGVLLLFCLPQLWHLRRSDIARSVCTGLVLGFSLLFWVEGLQNTDSIAEGAFIVSLSVMLVPVVGRVFFAAVIPRTLIVALFPAVLGLGFLTLDNGFRLQSGQLYFLMANVGFALHLNLSAYFVSGISSLTNTTIQLCSVACVALVAALLKESWQSPSVVSAWTWVFASAIVATSFRFLLQNRALKSVLPSHAAMIYLLEPIWVAVLGVIFLGELMSSNKLFGCGFILIALLVFRWPIIAMSLGLGKK